MFSQVTKEAKARMEGKAGGEGKTKRLSKEELLHPYSAKKIDGERSDLEKVIIALLVFVSTTQKENAEEHKRTMRGGSRRKK